MALPLPDPADRSWIMRGSTVSFMPVRVEPEILQLVLAGLEELAAWSPHIDFWFYDDNDDVASGELLQSFATRFQGRASILPQLELVATDYSRSGDTHEWSSNAVDRIAAIKNAAIRRFLETDARRLFVLDADVVVRPDLVDHLEGLAVDVVSAVYWTSFQPGQPYLPNVWDSDVYGFDSAESVLRLRDPGHYPVGGLGACTLIDRRVLEAGVDFSRIHNVGMWGEDRHFCIRAAVQGFSLVADTCLTPFHIYREELLDDARRWIADGMRREWFTDRWLTRAWGHAVRLVVGNQSVA